MEFYYKIADLNVKMDTFGRTLTQAEPYRCPPVEQPDISLADCWKLIQPLAPQYNQDDCEYMGTGGCFYLELLRHSGMMLHSSAVILDGRAYLFTAPSGTGKSTHTQLWLQQFGSRAQILNDDKPALRKMDGTWYAYGTPWSGKTNLNIPTRAPLAGICMLERGPENRIAPAGCKEALLYLMSQTQRPRQKELAENFLVLLDDLITTVPLWKLQCNMDPQAAQVSCNAMSGVRKDGKQ